MLDEKSRTLTTTAIAELITLLEKNEISESAATLITNAAVMERGDMLPDNEKVGGIVLVTVGVDRAVNMVLEGEFLPTLAYGALVETILQLWTTSQVNAYEGPIKSMVADMLGQAAILEKHVTGSDEH